MTPNVERVTFTKKKKTVACPVPLAPLADTHAHLLSFWSKEVPETLARAKEAGIDLLVTVFDPIADKRSVADYSDWLVREILPMRDIPQIKYLAGVHPYGAPDYTDDVHAQVVAALDDPLCAGIGEIGLDYHYDLSPREDQRRAFRRQIRLAHTTGLPAALHVREAHDEAFAILREEGFPEAGTLLHCFDLDWETLEPWVDRGCFVALGGALTFKRCQDTRDAVARTPRNLLLTETDSPYMTPEPMRGMPCGPAHTVFTAACMAEVLGCETEKARSQMLAQIAQNARALLDRPPTAWQIEHAQTAATERNCE